MLASERETYINIQSSTLFVIFIYVEVALIISFKIHRPSRINVSNCEPAAPQQHSPFQGERNKKEKSNTHSGKIHTENLLAKKKMEVLEKNHHSAADQIQVNGNRIPKLSFVYTEKMSSSTDDSDELFDPLSEELRNIQSVMQITRENIDALNTKFANLQEPPPMYVTEYQELTSKLHELEIKEHELVERLQQNEILEPPDQPEGPDEVSTVFFIRFFCLFCVWISELYLCGKKKLNGAEKLRLLWKISFAENWFFYFQGDLYFSNLIYVKHYTRCIAHPYIGIYYIVYSIDYGCA